MADPSEPQIKPDPRVNPWRDDKAAEPFRGEIDAPAYARGHDRAVIAPVTALRRAPAHGAMMDTQLLLGEKFRVYEERGPWVWGQAQSDDYVGYVLAEDLGVDIATTHRVTAFRSFIYTDPDIKSRPLMAVSMGAHVRVTGAEGAFAVLADGSYIFADHIDTESTQAQDFVRIAERFIGVPYLWGGRESLGLDCSALVQISLSMCGHACPRDSDMQEAVLGAPVSGIWPVAIWFSGKAMSDFAKCRHAAARQCHAYVRGQRTICARNQAHWETAGDIRQIRRMA